VVIGATAETLQDFELTPLGRLSGPEIQASNIATLLQDRGLQPMPPVLLVTLLLTLGVGAGWILTGQKSTGRVLLIALGSIIAWAGISLGVFLSGWIMPITFSGGILLGGMGASEAGRRAVTDQLEKLRLRRTLDRYVSAPIAQEIMSQREEFENLLKGRRRQVAVLFSDLRGFTHLCSEIPPEGLVPQLNLYLTQIVEAITAHEGCVDKFIGDAVMAEFGAPISAGEKQDAINAVKAALQIRLALHQLRQQWQEEGKPLFFCGVGINCGEVIAGNVGSLQRLEYTVMGDTVNTASRVESLTKEFNTDIIITQSVYDHVSDQFDAILLGTRQLRGRGSETALFQVIGEKGSGREMFDRVHRDYLARLEKTDPSRKEVKWPAPKMT
jgi:adenylate cyclase